MADVDVTDNPEEQRYEAKVGGQLAGFAAYRPHGEDVLVLTHTEVDPAYEGQGVGGALARGALDDVRARGGRRVVALCPFIGAWVARHPDYQDLLAP
jgi:predicted GNAT family acetyltransferase